ncbi:RloB domain-containing protein [Escherichia coli]|nr:RloB domain-containing protein [Escherichia coli]HAM6311151.1 RloB domain-containing protein [Escherichia coli]
MGSEDLFKKRKARRNNEFKRVSKARAQMKKILIVCEGEKTEPAYFTDFIKHCRISTASIVEISGECGSSPMNVVSWAKEKYNTEKKGATLMIRFIVSLIETLTLTMMKLLAGLIP